MAKEKYELLDVPLDLIHPSKDNPRKKINEEELQALVESIGEHGLLEEISVRKDGDGFEIIDGERRWRAARLRKDQTIRAKVYGITAFEAQNLRLTVLFMRPDVDQFDLDKAIYKQWKEGVENGEYETEWRTPTGGERREGRGFAAMHRATGIPKDVIRTAVEAVKEREKVAIFSHVSKHDLHLTRTLEESVRFELAKRRVSGEITQRQLEVITSVIKAAPEDKDFKDFHLNIAKGEISLEDVKETGALEETAPEARREILTRILKGELTKAETREVVKVTKEVPPDIRTAVATGTVEPHTALIIAKLPSENERTLYTNQSITIKGEQEEELREYDTEVENAVEGKKKKSKRQKKKDVAALMHDNRIVRNFFILHTNVLATVQTDALDAIQSPDKRAECFAYVQDIIQICERVIIHDGRTDKRPVLELEVNYDE